MQRQIAAIVLCFAIVTALAVPASSQTVDLAGFEAIALAEGLDAPVAFDFVGSSEILVLQRDGEVVLLRDGERVGSALRLPATTVGARGGLGLAVASDFADSGKVWLHYSAGVRGSWSEDRIAQATFNGTRLTKVKVLARIARDRNDDPQQRGGTLRIGPDGHLYALVGAVGREGGAAGIEQNGDAGPTGVGGILRLDARGEAASDNPFVDDPDAGLHGWYAYGLREGSGLSFDPVTGDAWFGDPGAGVNDEVNHGIAGANGGWASLSGPQSRAPGASDLTEIEGSTYVDPALTWVDGTGISALAFLDTKRYGPPQKHQLIAGDLDGNLHRLPLKGRKKARSGLALKGGLRDGVADDASEAATLLWGTGFGSVRDLRIGPDGLLYVLDGDGGRLLRIQRPPESVATYRVTFTATWSASTHPDPGFPANPHFSGLIGGTHSRAATFWMPGALASPGIKNMAETGGKAPLDAEVGAAIAAGTAEHLLSGDPIVNSPDAVSLQFDISRDFPLVSLVTMVAPSPDWFTGVHGLSLLRGGEWIDELSIELRPYDAGTDSGASFTSADAVTVPAEPIQRIVGPPFGPGDVPIGTFRFERVR